MSLFDTCPSLTEAKKQRKKLEEDALLLNNRIKLLEIEEKRTWKKIEEIKKRQKTIDEIRKKHEEAANIKSQLQEKKESIRKENNIKIYKLKEQIKNEKKKKIEMINESRRKNHHEIRDLREKNMKEKYQIYVESVKTNQLRSKSVKIEHQRQAIKFKRLERSREEGNRQEYLRKVQMEEIKKKEIENKVAEMEVIEMELIKKLQNTQMIQAKTISDLEAALKKKSASALN
jgi:hypothetical protein